MTVSYQYDVASSSTGGFFRLLWRWRGSIWKLLYKELLLFVAVYICIAITYDFLMTDYYKKYYEHIVVFCSAFVEVIPLSFILGFYVSFTAHRWWQQYTAIPWPDKLMNIIALYIPGNDVTSRVLRRTLMRYLNLTLVLVLRSISIPVKRRFPTKEHLVEAGFMSRPELEIYQSVPSHEFNTFWIPCTWFVNLLREAKSECRITDSGGIKLIMEEFNEFRSKCGLLWSYDWVSIPLVYTQVVTLSTQAFFLASLLGRQHINPSKENPTKTHIYGEYYIPIFTMLQFILYMGLLKLGEQLINPFGDDDEDFELNWIIDRHLKVSFLGVDILNSDPPPLIKDNYFDEMDIKLPYTEASVAHKVKTYRGSVAAFHVPAEKHGLVIPEFEDDNGEDTDDEPSTCQSTRDATRSNSWSLFGPRKRKLSSSFDSFNSETMVETGLGSSETDDMPELVANSSWPTFLANEKIQPQEQQQAPTKSSLSSQSASSFSKLGVWPTNNPNNNNNEDNKANEDTQGIRWSDRMGHTSAKPPPNTDTRSAGKPSGGNGSGTAAAVQQPGADQTDQSGKNATFKQQSSFSTSDSSIAITMGETTDQFSNAASAPKLFKYRKHPLQVFSKEYANAPISVFNQILEANLRRESKLSGDGISLSSFSLKMDKSRSRTPKSLIKCQRQVDPKLRIRPFRSKVTFSDDTKAGDNTIRTSHSYSKFQYKWDSSCDSMASLMLRQQDELGKTLKRSTSSPNAAVTSGVASRIQVVDGTSFADHGKRRQSLADPTMYRGNEIAPKPEVLTSQENWLHHQSLPNIQEEDLPQLASPLETSAPADFPCTGEAKSSSPPPPSLPPLPSLPDKPPAPPKTPAMLVPPSPLAKPTVVTLETPTPAVHHERKRSIKRQKSQEIPDEDLKIRLSLNSPTSPQLTPSAAATITNIGGGKAIIKQSSEDSAGSSNSSSTNNKGSPSATTNRMPIGILRKRKEDLKQASTESDTGSYHTVKSFLMTTVDNSSSLDSFSSAVLESSAKAANTIDTSCSASITITTHHPVEPPPPDPPPPSTAESRLISFPTIESTLVPKIIFSQSTPSVTSQSSDDQNSPKWDDPAERKQFESVTESALSRRLKNVEQQQQQKQPASKRRTAISGQPTTPSERLPSSPSSKEEDINSGSNHDS